MSTQATEAEPQRPGKNAALAEWRRGKAVELRLEGRSYDEVAREVGYANRGTAYRVVQQTLEAQTVENVLDFSVADAMAEATDEEDIHLHDLVGDLAPALEAANDAKGLEIRFELEGAPAVFRSRRRPIKSILLNLAVNAIRFTDRGCVTIAIRRAGSTQLGAAIELEVRDTGPGIKAELVEQAFKPCVQLSSSSVRSHRGMGLGLAVVQRNVEALGAKIMLKPALPQGSAFVVIVPIAEPVTENHPIHS